MTVAVERVDDNDENLQFCICICISASALVVSGLIPRVLFIIVFA